MEANKLNVGDLYYYISVPLHCDWTNIKVQGPCRYKGNEDLEQYIYSKTPNIFNDMLSTLRNNIIRKFRELNGGWEATPDVKQYWVTLNYAPHLKTIHCKGAKAPTNTAYNYFDSKEKAEEMKKMIIDTFTSFNKQLQ